MKKLILFFCLWPIASFSQIDDNLKLEIDNFTFVNDTMSLTIHIQNNSNKVFIFYKVGLKDICKSVLKIYAWDTTGNRYEYYPCKETIDLESIYLDCNNVIKLASNEGFLKIFQISTKDFIPLLKKGKYKLSCEINNSIANYETELGDVFREDLVSESIFFNY